MLHQPKSRTRRRRVGSVPLAVHEVKFAEEGQGAAYPERIARVGRLVDSACEPTRQLQHLTLYIAAIAAAIAIAPSTTRIHCRCSCRLRGLSALIVTATLSTECVVVFATTFIVRWLRGRIGLATKAPRYQIFSLPCRKYALVVSATATSMISSVIVSAALTSGSARTVPIAMANVTK